MRLAVFVIFLLLPASALAESNVPISCVQSGANILVHPIPETHQIPPYPTVSQRLGEHGTVQLQVLIDKFGVPVEVAIGKSSGSPRLDKAALAKVRDDWRWQPLTGECETSGVATAVDVVWNLASTDLLRVSMPIIYATGSDYPESAQNQKEEGVAVVAVALSETGVVLQNTLLADSGFPELDAMALQIALRQKYQPAVINGKPVPGITYITVAFLLDGPATPQSTAPYAKIAIAPVP
jgi:TonB family protein